MVTEPFLTIQPVYAFVVLLVTTLILGFNVGSMLLSRDRWAAVVFVASFVGTFIIPLGAFASIVSWVTIAVASYAYRHYIVGDTVTLDPRKWGDTN